MYFFYGQFDLQETAIIAGSLFYYTSLFFDSSSNESYELTFSLGVHLWSFKGESITDQSCDQSISIVHHTYYGPSRSWDWKMNPISLCGLLALHIGARGLGSY